MQIIQEKPGHRHRRENISVAVRCRPAGPKSVGAAWSVDPKERRVLPTPEVQALGTARSTATYYTEVERQGRRVKLENFEFDAVFGEDATTRQVYQSTAQPIVLSALDGINGSIMTYGQTGAPSQYSTGTCILEQQSHYACKVNTILSTCLDAVEQGDQQSRHSPWCACTAARVAVFYSWHLCVRCSVVTWLTV